MHASTRGVLNRVSTVDLSKYPKIKAGIVAIIMYHPRLFSGVENGLAKNALTKFTRSFQKKTTRESIVPSWTMIKYENIESLAGMPRIFCNMSRWAVEETGMNSVSP
jgi:hypothetical protein